MKHFLPAFIALFICVPSQESRAQSPGGVPSPQAWFRAVPTGNFLTGSYRWKDLAGDSIRLVSRSKKNLSKTGAASQPFSLTHSFNFHPALYFPTRDSLAEFTLNYTSLPAGTIVGVFAPTMKSVSTDATLYEVSGRKGEGRAVNKDQVHHIQSGDALDYGKETGEDLLQGNAEQESRESFIARLPRTVSYLWGNRPTHSVWGEATRTVITLGITHAKSDSRFSESFADALMGGNELEGYIPELVVFSRMLTPSERLRVESSLALRHGITLKGSYLDGKGNLIWDAAHNAPYHHRVTGIIRDDGNALAQFLSTTSYEESPRYSIDKNGDSFYEGSPYNLSSSQRLLVLGREYGSKMQDEGYLLWGDDGKPTQLNTLPEDSLWHLSGRTWLAQTNLKEEADTSQVRWHSQDFTITRKGFTDHLVRKGDGASASIISTPLISEDGSLEFICPTKFPSFDIGFTTSSDGNCNDGFRIPTATEIQAIENGMIKEAHPLSSIAGKRLLVRKEGTHIFLSVDGTGSDRFSVHLQEQPTATSYKAVIKVNASGSLDLADVRLTGTAVSGNMAELAYALLEDKGAAFTAGKQPLLVIDPTGQGDFSADTLRYVKLSHLDPIREKLIFHNIFFDTDGSGSDAFTFGYYDGLKAIFTPVQAHCKDGKALFDGSIGIGIELGTPSYTYELRASDVVGLQQDSIVSRGTFQTETHTVGELRPGLYSMTLSQGGSNEITASGSGFYTIYSADPRSFSTGSVSWSMADVSSNVRIGIQHPGKPSQAIYYGFDIRNGKAMPIIKGATNIFNALSFSAGDSLSISTNGKNISYCINGKEVYHIENSLRQWSTCIKYGSGTSHVSGFKVNGAHVPEFVTNSNATVRYMGVCSIHRDIRIGSECGAEASEVIAQPKTRGKASQPRSMDFTDERFSVVQDGGLTLLARLRTSPEEQATLMIFDTYGRCVAEQAFGSGTERTLRMTLKAPGVYIAKAVTHTGEHTCKFMIQ